MLYQIQRRKIQQAREMETLCVWSKFKSVIQGSLWKGIKRRILWDYQGEANTGTGKRHKIASQMD